MMSNNLVREVQNKLRRLENGCCILHTRIYPARAVTGSHGKKQIFWPKTEFDSNHVLATTGESCTNEEVPFSQIGISLLTNFGCFLEEKKQIFGQT